MIITKTREWGNRAWAIAGLGVATALIASGTVLAQDFKPPPPGASVKITSPTNGAVVKSPVKIRMAVQGMKVAPAGPPQDGTGHHHLIVNTIPPPMGVAVPADAQNLHYGKGQTEAELVLPPGVHTITAQFADGLHRAYGPQMTDTIIIKVE